METLGDTEILAPHFKRRLSGVTSSIIQLVPAQRRHGDRVATIGPGLPAFLPHLPLTALLGLWSPPRRRAGRIWHARRNIEMLPGILMRDLLRMKLTLLFTSAAQRRHSAWTRFLIGRMDGVVATSARSGSFLEVPHRVIRHGIDLARFHPPASPEDEMAATGLPGRHLIGCFGRIRHQKGTDLFVDAMIALLPRYPDWTAILCGRITPEHTVFGDALKGKIAAAGLAERILFLGEVEDVRPWYRRLSLYVAPSRNEGFGLTPLEAMASQTAVVASDAGAYAEMILEGETGAVVPAGDGDALTRAIEPYLADPARAELHGERGLDHVRAHFAIEREAAALSEVYEALFAGRPVAG
ncbi:glycosyltransferase family 4 protein [Rhizobium sp. YIM 134829]|uniref:glycosyltransferase family 4 protein n=1 Tax=Rhizobium sp. YIM 134829 TaxID=3390453 RepID=UPI00397D46D0